MWRKPSVVPERIPPEQKVHLVPDFDYRIAKLFVLSVLWRASVSKLETHDVQLGPHAEKIRQMILNGDPGRRDLYPVLGFFVVNPEDDHQLVPTVGPPFRWKIHGHNAWVIAMDTCEWLVFVSSHIVKNAEGIGLRDDNNAIFGVNTWADTWTMKSMRHNRQRTT